MSATTRFAISPTNMMELYGTVMVTLKLIILFLHDNGSNVTRDITKGNRALLM